MRVVTILGYSRFSIYLSKMSSFKFIRKLQTFEVSFSSQKILLPNHKSDSSRKNLFSGSYGTSPITDDGKSYAEKGMIGYSRFRRNCQSPLCCSGPNVQHELDLQTQQGQTILKSNVEFLLFTQNLPDSCGNTGCGISSLGLQIPIYFCVVYFKGVSYIF